MTPFDEIAERYAEKRQPHIETHKMVKTIQQKAHESRLSRLAMTKWH